MCPDIKPAAYRVKLGDRTNEGGVVELSVSLGLKSAPDSKVKAMLIESFESLIPLKRYTKVVL